MLGMAVDAFRIWTFCVIFGALPNYFPDWKSMSKQIAITRTLLSRFLICLLTTNVHGPLGEWANERRGTYTPKCDKIEAGFEQNHYSSIGQ